MVDSPDPVKRVLLTLLHDRGIEVTPQEFRIWLDTVVDGYKKKLGKDVTHDQICIGLLQGDSALLAAMQRTFRELVLDI